MNYKVVEIFDSINGEGPLAGRLSTFVRFASCNLRCHYCDTRYAYDQPQYTLMSLAEILTRIEEASLDLVTLTGGEPLAAPHVDVLIEKLGEMGKHVEIETNGSIDIAPFHRLAHRPSFTLDYKLPGSGMSAFMKTENYQYLKDGDIVKFVCGAKDDLEEALRIIRIYHLNEEDCYFSAVFNQLAPRDIVDFLLAHKLKAKVQLQLHKYIWDPMKRGV